MAGEPTLRHRDEGADGWVKYLQQLLVLTEPSLEESGVFDDDGDVSVGGADVYGVGVDAVHRDGDGCRRVELDPERDVHQQHECGDGFGFVHLCG